MLSSSCSVLAGLILPSEVVNSSDKERMLQALFDGHCPELAAWGSRAGLQSQGTRKAGHVKGHCHPPRSFHRPSWTSQGQPAGVENFFLRVSFIENERMLVRSIWLYLDYFISNVTFR